MELVNKIRTFRNSKVDASIISEDQLDYLVLYALDAIEKGIEGDFVEFGCYVGESSKYLRKTLDETKSNKDLYVYDSFEGLPPLSKWEENTGWRAGTLNVSEEILIKNFRDNNLKPPYTNKGWFKDIPDYRIPDKIAFAFLDGDFYDSIFDSLTKIYNKVSDGGYILFHDYERNDLPGVKAAIEAFFALRGESFNILKVCDQVGAIQKNRKVEQLHMPTSNMEIKNKDLTVVTGLWNINRPGRDFNHYIEHFKNFLDIPVNMFIFIPAEYEYLVWEKRSRDNTFVKVYELEDVKNLYSPHWDITQKIRITPEWFNKTGEHGWLVGSPQSSLEWYNPIVQSKMFMLNDVTIWNPFNTEYFIWLDAGITNTVYDKFFSEHKALDKINPHLDTFLFLSYPYEANDEIHGFDFTAMNRYAGKKVEHVCRGGLFGGRKNIINDANNLYYPLLQRTLGEGYMGTEESIFTLMSYIEPEKYRRYALDGNGLVTKFIQALLDDKVELEPIPEQRVFLKPKNLDTSKLKTSLYILTFNFPEQVRHTLETYKLHPEWLDKTRKILIDNSNNDEAVAGNKAICEEYGIEHLVTGENLGINRGRLYAAKHFQESDSDYYIFLEDDMGIYNSTSDVCRNGFRQYIPGLFEKIHKIMLKEEYDFLKLSFTEVYMDNHMQCSWYNVPQFIRTEMWPEYDKLPIQGLDMNCPRTRFNKIDNVDGLTYIDGDVYYANWPMIVGKVGNQKMFLDIDWTHPYEQTWMSHMFQETRKGNIKPAILLASPINHNRISHYSAQDRREN
jgi:O-methyltransferase